MQHYFLKNLTNNISIFDDGDIHHIIHVMRNKTNDNVVGIYNAKKYLISLVILNKDVIGKVVKELDSIDNTLDVTLIYGMPKNEKFELAIQKATELGVKRIVPFLSERCIVKLEPKDYSKKLERWNKICKEASEQSERVTLPIITNPIKLKEIKDYKSDINLVCDESFGRTKGKNIIDFIKENKGKSISIIIGPEGGFSPEEFDTFFDFRFVSCGLGNRILRSETAVIYAMSAISMINEEN